MDRTLRTNLTTLRHLVRDAKQKALAMEHAATDLQDHLLIVGAALAETLEPGSSIAQKNAMDAPTGVPESTVINGNETFANDVAAVPDTASGATVVPGQAKPDHYPAIVAWCEAPQPFKVGESHTINIQLWKSADEMGTPDLSRVFTALGSSVASVDNNGVLTANGAGTTIIRIAQSEYRETELLVTVV